MNCLLFQLFEIIIDRKSYTVTDTNGRTVLKTKVQKYWNNLTRHFTMDYHEEYK